MSESDLEIGAGEGDTSSPAVPFIRNPASPTLLLLILLLLGAAVTAAYLPSLPGPFALDDINNIVENPTIRMHRLDIDSFLRTMTPAEKAHAGRLVA